MRRYLVLFILILIPSVVVAQGYQPTTTWPYVYRDFQEGEAVYLDGSKVCGWFNIALPDGRLHFLEEEMVREVTVAVRSVEIDGDRYLNIGGKLRKVLAIGNHGEVLEDIEIDFATLNSTGGAYGSSSNTLFTRSLSSVEGIGLPTANVNHMELKNEKDMGRILPLIRRNYLCIDGRLFQASKSEIQKSGIVSSKAFKIFLKENRIKWKDPDSLLIVIDFLAGTDRQTETLSKK